MGNTIGNAGASFNNLLTNVGQAVSDTANAVGNAVEEGANAVQGAVNEAGEAISDAASGVEHAAGQYIQDRGERLEEIGNKVSNGHILDAAMDAFQGISIGGKVSDMAHAMGMVESPADRSLLSGVVNAMTGNFVAAAGDGEDFLQNMQPRLQQAQHTIDNMDISFDASANVNVEMAGSHHVPGPMSHLQASMNANLHVNVRQSEDPRPANGGYAGGRVRGRIDFGKVRGQMDASGRYRCHPNAGKPTQGSGHSQGAGFKPTIVTRHFGEAIPGLQRHYANAQVGSAQSRPAMPNLNSATNTANTPNTSAAQNSSATDETSKPTRSGVSDQTLSNILSDPILSFEDKMFLFLMAVTSRKENQVLDMMKRYDTAMKDDSSEINKSRAERDGKTAAKKGASSNKETIVFDKSASGNTYPIGGKNDSMAGGIVDAIKGQGPGIIRMLGMAAPIAGPLIGSAIGTLITAPIGGVEGAVIGGAIGEAIGLLGPVACNQFADSLEKGDFDDVLNGAAAMLDPQTPEAQKATKAVKKSMPNIQYVNHDSKAAGPGKADSATPKEEEIVLTKAEKKKSDQAWTMELQHAQEQLTKMYTALSNIMKASHDTQMTAVRNLR